MSKLTPDVAETLALRDQVPPGPVVMVNLLKFKQPDGRERFNDYGAVTAPLIQKVGGQVIYAGEAGPVLAGAETWDTVILVRFDDIERFIEMVTHETYQTEARTHREAALERTIWMASTPLS